MAEDKICPFTLEKPEPSICIGERCMAWRNTYFKPSDPYEKVRPREPVSFLSNSEDWYERMRLEKKELEYGQLMCEFNIKYPKAREFRPEVIFPDPEKSFLNCARLAILEGEDRKWVKTRIGDITSPPNQT